MHSFVTDDQERDSSARSLSVQIFTGRGRMLYLNEHGSSLSGMLQGLLNWWQESQVEDSQLVRQHDKLHRGLTELGFAINYGTTKSSWEAGDTTGKGPGKGGSRTRIRMGRQDQDGIGDQMTVPATK